MTLIVEDGTGKADAESYCSVSFADAYLTKRGVSSTAWGDLDTVDEKEPALRRAATYMVERYRTDWQGYRATPTQALDWPRYQVEKRDVAGGTGYYDWTTVPIEIQQACALLAARTAAGEDLSPDLGPPVIEETVGPITTKYAAGARQTTKYQQIDNLLAVFLKSGNGYMFGISRG